MVASIVVIRVAATPYYSPFVSPYSMIRTKVKLISCSYQLQKRRSGNYKPTLWDYDYVQSLDTSSNLVTSSLLIFIMRLRIEMWVRFILQEKEYLQRASDLRKQVRELLILEEIKKKPVTEMLELVDSLQRLGISYYFENEIKEALTFVSEKRCEVKKRDLYSTAMEFRLLKQHDFNICQDVFDCFINEKGEFVAVHCDNTKGLLQLYEASFMLIPGEKSMELARNFAKTLLQTNLEEGHLKNDETLSLMVRKALEMPIHWRVVRPNSRWFINLHQQSTSDINPVVLQLAELDFNIVQAHHQKTLKHVSRWWKQTGLSEVLLFARDRLVESYFITLRFPFQPKYGYSIIVHTKVNEFVVIIDDIFDVYGTMEELHLFNNAIQSWNSEEIEKLPHYMKSCFWELDYFINEVAYVVLNEQGIIITPFLRQSEAEWFSKVYTPTVEEYLDNAWMSISGPLLLSHTYFLLAKPISDEAIQQLFKPHNLIRYSSLIVRLANDLGTSPDEIKRGDIPKSVQCYIHETGASIEEAQEQIKLLMDETWKKINEEVKNAADSPFPRFFIEDSVELGRMGMHVYDQGDGFGMGTRQIKQSITQLLFEPIP